jgi:hypothetical protein
LDNEGGVTDMSTYKPFPQANLIREWDKLIKLSKEDVVKLYEEWKVIHAENQATNKRIYEEKNQKLKEVADYLKSVGIDVHKYKKSGFFPQTNGYQAWYMKNIYDPIANKYPYYSSGIPTAHMDTREVDGIKLSNNQSPTNIVELHERMTWQYNMKKGEANKVDKLLIKSIEYAAKNNIDIDEMSPKDIIAIAHEVASENYLKENCPDGTEIYLKHGCYECSSYTVGDHRCSCGNRRISIQVEGDLINGFDYYPEPY